jgi:hypothetical protein
MTKARQLPFNPSSSTSSYPLEIIHSDVWGHFPITSLNGFHYYAIFVDDFSRFIWIYFMQNKSEVPLIFSQFKAQRETESDSSIKEAACRAWDIE